MLTYAFCSFMHTELFMHVDSDFPVLRFASLSLESSHACPGKFREETTLHCPAMLLRVSYTATALVQDLCEWFRARLQSLYWLLSEVY